jgi:hypothetical protein
MGLFAQCYLLSIILLNATFSSLYGSKKSGVKNLKSFACQIGNGTCNWSLSSFKKDRVNRIMPPNDLAYLLSFRLYVWYASIMSVLLQYAMFLIDEGFMKIELRFAEAI